MINLVITTLVQVALIDFVASRSFEGNKKKLAHIIGILGSTFLILVFNLYGPNHLGSLFYMISGMLLLEFLYSSTFIDNLMLIFLQFICVSLSEFIVMLIFNLMFNMNQLTEINSVLYSCALASSLLVSFLLSFVVIMLLKLKTKYEKIPYSKLSLILPIITCILILNIRDYFDMVENHVAIFIVLIGLLISNIVSLYFFNKALQSMRLEAKLEIEKERTLLSKEHVQLLNEQYNNNFDYLHSLLHKMIKIRDMDKEEIGDELEKLTTEMDAHFNSMLTNSLSLNTVINKYMMEIENFRIQIRTTIFDAISFMDFENQVELFDFLLRISIENCKQCNIEDRLIIISAKNNTNMFMLKIVFPHSSTTVESIDRLKAQYIDQCKVIDVVNEQLGIISISMYF